MKENITGKMCLYCIYRTLIKKAAKLIFEIRFGLGMRWYDRQVNPIFILSVLTKYPGRSAPKTP